LNGRRSEEQVLVRLTKRIVGITIGFILLAAGLVMLVTPGPGVVALALGLALLAREFHWARRLLDRLKARSVEVRDAIRRATQKT
jgi:uncharacterized protein (TIGR02611 family)